MRWEGMNWNQVCRTGTSPTVEHEAAVSRGEARPGMQRGRTVHTEAESGTSVAVAPGPQLLLGCWLA